MDNTVYLGFVCLIVSVLVVAGVCGYHWYLIMRDTIYLTEREDE